VQQEYILCDCVVRFFFIREKLVYSLPVGHMHMAPYNRLELMT
jgi:hypothetical protein